MRRFFLVKVNLVQVGFVEVLNQIFYKVANQFLL